MAKSMDNTRESEKETNDGLLANHIYCKKSNFTKLDLMMKNRFLGMNGHFRRAMDVILRLPR